MIGEAAVRILPETRFFARDVGRQLSGPLKLTFGRLAGAAAGAFAGVKVLRFFGDSIKEAQEARKVFKLTNAVLKSTGGVAKVSAKQVSALADSLSAISGVDDEVIAAGENLLLTFTKVRNEAGKGNDIFNQTTVAALDLSAALGQDMQSSVLQLGKALQDPIRGVTALRRAGVSFTQSQQDQIKALVEVDDLLGAQKIILSELTTQFGGAAEAAASPWDRMKVAVGNLQESIGDLLLPVLDKLANFMSTTLVPVLKNRVIPAIRGFFRGLGDVVGNVREVFGVASQALVKSFFQSFTGDDAKKAKESLSDTADEAIRLADVTESFTEDVGPVLVDVFASIGDVLGTVANGLEVFGATMFDVGAAVQRFVRNAIGAFQAFGGFLADFFLRFRGVFNGIGAVVTSTFRQVGNILAAARGVVSGFISFIVGAFTGNLTAAIHGVGRVFSSLGNFIKEGIANSIGILQGLAGIIVGVFSGVGRGIFNVGRNIAVGFFEGIISTIGRLASRLPGIIKRLIPDAIRDFFGIRSPSKLMFGLGENIGKGLTLGIERGITFDASAIDLNLPTATGNGARRTDVTVVVPHQDPRVLANELSFMLAREVSR